VLEVPAAEWAAERRTEEDLVRIRHAHRHVEAGKVVVERADFSADFHQAVMHAAHNRLMSMIAPPVWRVFTRCAVERGGVRHIWRHIDHDHEMILQHIERHEPTEAAEAMRMHLERLREHNL
jgi:DNA-binding FadR family transcriptional regulator